MGAKQHNKLATYGKGLRHAPPSYDIFSIPVDLDDHDHDLARVTKRRTTGTSKTTGIGTIKTPFRKDVKHLPTVQAPKLESKSVFDVPSSDSEEEVHSQPRTSSKKRKRDHQATNLIQDGVYDDESLQRHIAAEAQRDQENLRFFAQSKAKRKLPSAAPKSTMRPDSTRAKKPKAKASSTNKGIQTVMTPANSITAPNKQQTPNSLPKSQYTASRSRLSSGLVKDAEPLSLPRTRALHNNPILPKAPATRARVPATEKDVTKLPRRSPPIGAIQSVQGTSPSISPGEAEYLRITAVSKSPSQTPRPIRTSAVEATLPTPKAKSLLHGDNRYQSPSTLGIQSMQLSSPPATPPAKRPAKPSTAIQDLVEQFKPASAPVQARRRIIDRLHRHSSCSSVGSDKEEEEIEMAGVNYASTQSSVSSTLQLLLINQAADKAILDEYAMENDVDTQQAIKSSQSTYGGVTYEHQRSYLTEEMVDEADLLKVPLLPDPAIAKSSRRSKATGKAPNLPGLPSRQGPFEIEEGLDDTGSGPTQNIHELRQAGGNARLLGSMEAMLDDIDPKRALSLTTRRNGLFDLYRSLAQPASCQAFIDHGLVDTFVEQFDESLDDVTSILVMSCLASVLGQRCPMHLLTLINDAQGFEFLGARLQSSEEVIKLVRKRVLNLSRVMQQEFVQFSESLLASSMWAEETPPCLTARTLSLHCLEALMRHLREAGCVVDAISQQMISSLVDVAASAVDTSNTSSNLVPNISSTEFRQAISILEYTTTISPTTDMHKTAWTTASIEQTSQMLPTLCNHNGDQWGKARLLLFRLCLNLTNESSSTCEIFGKPEIVQAVVSMALSGFRSLDDEDDDESYTIVLGNVVLALGLLTNLAESSEAARLQFLKRSQGNKTSLDRLLQLFNSNVARASEVSCSRSVPSIPS